MANKDITLFGVSLAITFQPTEAELAQLQNNKKEATPRNFELRTEQLHIRPLRIGKYEDAARCLEAQDEVGFTAVAVSRDVKWIESLTPESYDRLAVAVQEVNQGGFFAYFGRRLGRRFAIEQAMLQGKAALRNEAVGESPSAS